MTLSWKEAMTELITRKLFENPMKKHFDKLKGDHKHYCPDWDGLPIDETCPEFDCCSCRMETMPTEISRQKLYRFYLGQASALAEFFKAHDHISDEALLNAGEVVMDGPAFYKLRRAFL